jgi:tetratricopeptide (TPR) repeat protein
MTFRAHLLLKPAGLAALVAAVGAMVLAATPARSQTREHVDWCVNTGNAYKPDLRIAGCTDVIDAGRWTGADILWALANRARAYEAKRDARAINDLNEAITHDPRRAMLYYERGRFYSGIVDDVASALRDFDRALAIDPNYADARLYRAGLRRRTGDYDGAIDDFTAALAITDDARIHVARAGAYRAMGDYARAIADYDEALTLVPGRIALIDSRGQLNFSMAHYDDAAADYTRVPDFDAGSAAAALWLYLARARGGDETAAKVDLAARASKLRQPEFPYAAVELYLGRGSPEAVLAAASRPVEHCEARIFVAEWDLVRGDVAAATKIFTSLDDGCSKYFIDYHELAAAELKRIGK